MRAMTLPNIAGEDGVKVAFFDLSIKDVNERRLKRTIAESKAFAARVLGLASINRLEAIIRNRERITWNGKTITIRYEHPKFDQEICEHKPQTNTQTPQPTAGS